MKVLKNKNDINLKIPIQNNFMTDLGWEDSLNFLVEEKLDEIINPIENYETKRIIHQPYQITNNGISINQCDIWYNFYFINMSDQYVQEYSPIGLSLVENARQLRETMKSFFKLEFFKTKNNELPNRNNRKIVFSKMLSIPLGERYFYDFMNDTIFRPTFTGSNIRNKENMYLYWYEDEKTVLDSDYLGNIFWFTAKFYNSNNGDILDFTNKDTGNGINESEDLYYKLTLNNDDSYVITDMNEVRVGLNNNPIKFYQRRW